MVPVTITLGILNFNALVDFFFAQFVSDHAAAQINYAFRLYQLPQGMFAITIGTVLFPTLSRYAADLDIDALSRDAVARRAPDLLRLAAVRRLVRGRAALDRAAHLPARRISPRSTRRRWRRSSPSSRSGMAFANVNVMFNRGFQSLQRPWLPLYVGARQPRPERAARLGAVSLARRARHRAVDLDRVGLQLRRPARARCAARSSYVDGRRILVSLAKTWPARPPSPSSPSPLWHVLRGFADSGLLALTVVVVAVFGCRRTRLPRRWPWLLRVEELSVV